MKKQEFKVYLIQQLHKILDQWFDTNTMQDKTTKALVKTIIETNKHKFDGFIDMVTDEQGEVRTDILIKNLEDILPESINIDLTQYAEQFNIPRWIIPNKILLMNKNDIRDVLNVK